MTSQQRKLSRINKSGMKHWKDCSFVEFLQSMTVDKDPRPYSEHPMADSLRRDLAEIESDEK